MTGYICNIILVVYNEEEYYVYTCQLLSHFVALHPSDNFDNLSCYMYAVYVLSKMQYDSMVKCSWTDDHDWFYHISYIFLIKSIFVELYICVSTHHNYINQAIRLNLIQRYEWHIMNISSYYKSIWTSEDKSQGDREARIIVVLFFLQRESCVCLQTTDCYEIICRQAEISMNLI